MKNITMHEHDGTHTATLVGGPKIAAAGETETEAIDNLVGYLSDLVNERNEQQAGVMRALGVDMERSDIRHTEAAN